MADLLDSLSASQRDTLASFQSITATEDLETATTILESTNWDLTAAISKIYDREPGAGASSSRAEQEEEEEEERPLMDQFGIDDSQVGMPPATGAFGPPGGGGPLWWIRQLVILPITLISWPVGLLLGAIARLLNLRPGAVWTLRPSFSSSPSRAQLSPARAAERWIRSVEELTGAIRWSRRNDGAASSGVAVGSSSSGLERRSGAGAGGAGVRTLLDFQACGYEQAVKKAKEDIQVLMVVLTCDEHQHDEELKKAVLTDEELTKTLAREGIVVWGGDTRDKDAYQASKLLHQYSLPFIAFIALQPPPNSASSSSPLMSVISRLEGSPSTTTSAATLLNQINTVVLPRVRPFLQRQRGEKETRLAERRLREEQDRAYAAAARKDEERVLRARAEEGRKKREKEEKEKKEAEAARLRDGGRRCRAWMRGVLEKEGEPRDGEMGTARIGVRLGDGRRAVRKFGSAETVERVYAFIECALEVDDGERLVSPPTDYEHIYAFRLATTFPRQMLDIDGEAGGRTVEQVGWLAPDASLVVEGLEQRRISLGETTSDEEEEEEN